MLTCIENFSLELLYQRKDVKKLKGFIDQKLYNKLINHKQELKRLVNTTIASFSDEGKALIESYSREWIFESPNAKKKQTK